MGMMHFRAAARLLTVRTPREGAVSMMMMSSGYRERSRTCSTQGRSTAVSVSPSITMATVDAEGRDGAGAAGISPHRFARQTEGRSVVELLRAFQDALPTDADPHDRVGLGRRPR